MEIDRRVFLKNTGVAIGALATSGGNLFGETGTRKPNLLIIHTDEHSFRTLGCYRDTLSPEQAFMWGKEAIVETPHIDWLAENGALCTSYYAASPLCVPSRASFVSGMYPTPEKVGAAWSEPLKDGVVTFAEVLKDNGYKTGYLGKWHLVGHRGKGHTHEVEWAPKPKFGFEDNRYMLSSGHYKMLGEKDGKPFVMSVDKNGLPTNSVAPYVVAGANEQNFTTDFLADKTINFIRDNKADPFCVMLSIPDPHGLDFVRKPYSEMYKGLNYENPRTFNKDPEKAPIWGKPKPPKNGYPETLSQEKYFGMVKCIDDNVGKIITYLREANLLDNTIIVFTADHGDLRGEHHREDKRVPYEGSAKIPFIVYDKAQVKPGIRISTAMDTSDFMPTILGLMKVPYKGEVDGRDMAGLWNGAKKESDFEDIAFMKHGKPEHLSDLSWAAAVTSRYKLVVAPKEKPWLLDLKADPDELINFVNHPKYKAIAKELAGKLLDWGERNAVAEVVNPKVMQDLESLKK